MHSAGTLRGAPPRWFVPGHAHSSPRAGQNPPVMPRPPAPSDSPRGRAPRLAAPAWRSPSPLPAPARLIAQSCAPQLWGGPARSGALPCLLGKPAPWRARALAPPLLPHTRAVTLAPPHPRCRPQDGCRKGEDLGPPPTAKGKSPLLPSPTAATRDRARSQFDPSSPAHPHRAHAPLLQDVESKAMTKDLEPPWPR